MTKFAVSYLLKVKSWVFVTFSKVEFSPKIKIQDLQNDPIFSFIPPKIANDFT